MNVTPSAQLEGGVVQAVGLEAASSSYTARTSSSFSATRSGLHPVPNHHMRHCRPPENRSVSDLPRDYIGSRKPIGTMTRWTRREHGSRRSPPSASMRAASPRPASRSSVAQPACRSGRCIERFGSKDGLVTAAYESLDLPVYRMFTAAIDARARRPARAARRVLRPARADSRLAGLPWLPLHERRIRAAGSDHPAHAVVRRHKERLRRWLRERAKAAGAADPGTLSRQLMLVFAGAQAAGADRTVGTSRPVTPSASPRKLIEAATRLDWSLQSPCSAPCAESGTHVDPTLREREPASRPRHLAESGHGTHLGNQDHMVRFGRRGRALIYGERHAARSSETRAAAASGPPSACASTATGSSRRTRRGSTATSRD